jgi:dimethylargininase
LFKNAIVRIPGENFEGGLTRSDLGKPSYEIALQQHAAYCRTLEQCGLHVMTLPPDLEHPDSTFVEDAAVLTPYAAILSRPGAKSREGEVPAIRTAVAQFYNDLRQIEAPGTLDGGDICEAGTHFFIGISHRTNPEGARQLAVLLTAQGFTSSTVVIREMDSILHLKSGIACLEERTLVVMEEMAGLEQFRGYKIIVASPEETYAANCVRVNDYVLFPAGYPSLQSRVQQQGFKTLPLDMSEFAKMDGGLSCLSLRF